MNVDGMLPFENMVADYIKETGNHVMYRVTPIFEERNLVCSGVLIEAYSVEDEGDGITFCVYAYNVQPGVEINYKTGQNRKSGDSSPDISGGSDNGGSTEEESGEKLNYVLNTSSKTYHKPSCRFASSMSEENRAEFFGCYDELIKYYPDYKPCGTCKP